MGVLDASPQAQKYDGTARRAIETIRHSVLLSMAVLGVLFVLLGYLIGTGPWAGIVATWGGGMVLIGVAGFLYVQWKRS